MVRHAYAHDAVVVMEPGGSPNAPGGAIAEALCGSWDHSPPCPLAPHHVANHVVGDEVVLRVLFATEPADEPRVRQLIGEALGAGEQTGPDGLVTTWRLKSTAASDIRSSEKCHAEELTHT
ncbi:hypothetical protein NM962_03060 [Mycobacterium sp. SVM_VP21]|nr:hypothetical protein NM962_03060 [Mycobacterium sp. SVM_VP21]